MKPQPAPLPVFGYEAIPEPKDFGRLKASITDKVNAIQSSIARGRLEEVAGIQRELHVDNAFLLEARFPIMEPSARHRAATTIRQLYTQGNLSPEWIEARMRMLLRSTAPRKSRR